MIERPLKKGLVFGDLHFDDSHKGRHINYLDVTYKAMTTIQDIVAKEKPDFLIFTGDIIGVRSKIIKSRLVLLDIIAFFTHLNRMTDNNVYVVRGNHDFGQNLDFEFLHGLGLIKTTAETKFVDIKNNSNGVDCRIHLVDYGSEKEELTLCQNEEASNVLVFHNNLKVEGKTTWYPECAGLDLTKMYNWEGCDVAIGGHIHNPSPYMVDTNIGNTPISLFYLGCMTRPTYERNIYTYCWYSIFEFDEENGLTSFDNKEIPLPDTKDVFYSDKFVEDLSEEEIAEKVRKEDLDALVKELVTYHIADGDPITIIKNMPNTTPGAVDIAVEYIQKAYNERGITRM